MRLRILLAALLLFAALTPASARMHAPYRGHRIVPANAAPLDGFTAPSGAYSFRRLRTAYAGPAVKLQRVDTTTQDIGFTAAGDFDTAAATAFCTTACALTTWYDQSGNGRNLAQATAANQPLYVPACVGDKPCLQLSANGGTAYSLNTAGTFTPNGVVSLSVVARRSVGLGTCVFVQQTANQNRVLSNSVANQWAQLPGIVVPNVVEGGWHVLNGTINGVSGVVNVDGVETPSSATGSVVTGAHGVFGSTTATCHESEVVIWPGYATTPAERSALLANQQQYWTPLPLDMFTQPSGAYGFRKLRSTYAGPAIRLRRASDNLETDVAFLGCTAFTGCPWDAAAAAAHCASTTCFGRTWYDQSGNARDLVQATPASQPQLTFNCNGGLPCFRSVGGELLASGGTITPATGNVAIGVVANRSAGTGTCSFLRENASNRIGAAGPANWTLAGSSGTITPTAADNAWHAANGNIAGASSVLNVDGAETAGTVTGSVAAGLVVLQGAASTTCSYAEGMFWDNYALTVNERTLLQQNQKNFWGTP